MTQLLLQSLHQHSLPVLPTPLTQYNTSLIWCGNVCYNPVDKTGRRIFANLTMEDVNYPTTLSRVDHIEDVKYVLYSSHPKIWSENDDLFIEVIKLDDPAKHYRKK